MDHPARVTSPSQVAEPAGLVPGQQSAVRSATMSRAGTGTVHISLVKGGALILAGDPRAVITRRG
jgi:hypothetical protein